jgi:membrane protein DedA with SNARE-associated domain
MTLGCIIAYGFGKGSRNAINRIPQSNIADIERFFNRHGNWAIVLARPIPVLAEASVIFAGISRMNFGQYMLGTSLSNLGISIMYAAVGSYSISVNSFLLALLGAISIPAIAWLFMYLGRKRNEQAGRPAERSL